VKIASHLAEAKMKIASHLEAAQSKTKELETQLEAQKKLNATNTDKLKELGAALVDLPELTNTSKLQVKQRLRIYLLPYISTFHKCLSICLDISCQGSEINSLTEQLAQVQVVVAEKTAKLRFAKRDCARGVHCSLLSLLTFSSARYSIFEGLEHKIAGICQRAEVYYYPLTLVAVVTHSHMHTHSRARVCATRWSRLA
jgi:hypothetical protein